MTKYGQHLFHKESEQQTAPDNVEGDTTKSASDDTMVKRRHARPLALDSEEEEDEEISDKAEHPKSDEAHVSAQVLFHSYKLRCTCLKSNIYAENVINSLS